MPRIYLSPPDIGPQDHAAVGRVLDSGWVAPAGPELEAFEAEVCGRTGRAHAVALSSGTAALHLALQVLGIGPGDRVVCPSLTFAASANPVCYCGAEPVFVDSERDSWNMDPALLEEALSALEAEGRGAKAVIVVHLYGQCAEMEAIGRICAGRGLPVIEDAAEALGASYRGRPAGSFGALSFFSFNGNKIVTTSGGGMLLSDEPEWIARARHLAAQAREPVAHYEHREIGYNYRLSNLLAGLGRSQLADLDRRIARRRDHYEAYRRAFADIEGLAMMPLREPEGANYWLSCLTVDPDAAGAGRDEVIAALAAGDIEARPLWKPLHRQPVFAGARVFGGGVGEALFARGLCLPSGSSLGEVDRDRICAIVRGCFGRGSAAPES
ncbi:MAG: DegT/DnrJ/EryC1/StrS family aminotransferase [Opitutales bacterium]